MGMLPVLIAAQVATVAFIVWPFFRIVRKAGFDRRAAWTVCVLCAGCSFGMSGLNVAIAMQGWIKSIAGELTLMRMVLVGIGQFVLSPFTACVIPLVFFTYRKWPLEGRSQETDIFG
jgi:hypothetical protein